MIGLTITEVRERTQQGLTNEQVSSCTKTVKEIVKENVFTYFNLIFTVLAVLLIVVGSFKDLSFMAILFANTGIGIAQELRSKRTLDKLKLMNMPHAVVLRDGNLTAVPVEELVLGDIIQLKAGAQIPADGSVVQGSLQVNEALLTGESDEITKKTDDELRSGSFVVSGECLAVLTAVGRESYISKLTIEATKNKSEEESEMIKSLDRLVKIIGVIIIPIGIIMVVQQFFIMNGTFSQSVTSMVAAVLGMIPEGLYLMASLAMVVSAMRLAKRKVLVQNMRCIETLARVDVLCVDKTGTITENDMKVYKMEPVSERYNQEEITSLLGDLVNAMSNDNATMAAMQNYFTAHSGREPNSICAFSSKYKYCGASYDDGNYVLGAPEFILREEFYRYENYINDVSEKGYRVLAFAKCRDIPSGDPLQGTVELIALTLLTNNIRKGAKETFEYFGRCGVDIKVISGDNPSTVSHVAQEAGIKWADQYLDARQLHTDRDVYEAVERYTVFGRVTPEQKRMFVKALKRQGKTVGMTGDGVNDILALKDSDCSIAMASGSEAAANVAQLVLIDSDFSKMPGVVEEGRRVVNNIQKAASLFLTKNIFSLLLAIFSMVSVLSYPLSPSQLTLITFFTIGAPSLVLSLEPNKDIISGKFFGNVFKMAAPAGITTFISVSSLVLFGQVFEIDGECISTACTILVALVGFMILSKVAQPMKKMHSAMMILLIAGLAACMLFAQELFGISQISGQCTMLLIVFLIATEGLFRYIYKFTSFCGSLLPGNRKKRRTNMK